jgi:putative transposase
MGAEADALCGAAPGERSADRVNRRNSYRERRLDSRVGTLELVIPKLRRGSYFPDWLLEGASLRDCDAVLELVRSLPTVSGAW